jgi:hypothetical protein
MLRHILKKHLAKHFQKEAAGASFAQTKRLRKMAVQELNTMLLTQFRTWIMFQKAPYASNLKIYEIRLQGFRRTQQQNAFGQAVDVDVALKPSFEQC